MLNELNRASRLEAAIREEIAVSERQGWVTVPPTADGQEALPAMTFRDYMAKCLYDERDGYYRSGTVRVGKSGDFYTSSGIGTVMSDKRGIWPLWPSANRGRRRSRSGEREPGPCLGRCCRLGGKQERILLAC